MTIQNTTSTVLYPINDCYVCVQGEGSQTGVAMVLLRLHGCEVGCPWCDTKETWAFASDRQTSNITEVLGTNSKYTYLNARAVTDFIYQNRPGPKWVLITGGEPAQYTLQPLVEELHTRSYKVALETSGTEIGHIGAGFDWVCVSPKIGMPGGKTIRSEALEIADEIKHVVGIQRDIDSLDELLSKTRLKADVQICLQPVSMNAKATSLCIAVVQQRGWRLSIQVHKYLHQP